MVNSNFNVNVNSRILNSTDRISSNSKSKINLDTITTIKSDFNKKSYLEKKRIRNTDIDIIKKFNREAKNISYSKNSEHIEIESKDIFFKLDKKDNTLRENLQKCTESTEIEKIKGKKKSNRIITNKLDINNVSEYDNTMKKNSSLAEFSSKINNEPKIQNILKDAVERETQLKGWSKEKKKALIESNLHKLQLLSECQNMTHSKYQKVDEASLILDEVPDSARTSAESPSTPLRLTQNRSGQLKAGILGGGQLGRMLLQAAANYPIIHINYFLTSATIIPC